MKISVFGGGYVGLVQATVLAEAGYDVLCIDIDPDIFPVMRELGHAYGPGTLNKM
jgi:UDPglucose 6-dehydrogenase